MAVKRNQVDQKYAPFLKTKGVAWPARTGCL